MNISNTPDAISAMADLPRQDGTYATASTSIAYTQKFSDAIVSIESDAESRNEAISDKGYVDWKKKCIGTDGSGLLAPAVQMSINVLPIAPAEIPIASSSITEDRTAAPSKAAAASSISVAGAAIDAGAGAKTQISDSLPDDAESVISQAQSPLKSDGANPSGRVANTICELEPETETETETATGTSNIVPADTEPAGPASEFPNETTPSPSGVRVNGVDIVSKPANIAHASTISPSPVASGLHTLADAFETSVRHFERSGAWVGRASFTLQSSALKGASFQLVSDGRSLNIQLAQMASASMPISRREENQLSEILTRKLGRDVSLNLRSSEIEAAENAEQTEQQ